MLPRIGSVYEELPRMGSRSTETLWRYLTSVSLNFAQVT
jgi:hypothetical protein